MLLHDAYIAAGPALVSVVCPWPLVGALSLGVILQLLALAQGWLIEQRRRRLLRENPSALADPMTGWPLLTTSSTIVGILLILLICLCLVVPVELDPGGSRVASAVTAVIAWASAAALLTLASRWWSGGPADAGMALITLGMCALALCALPSEPRGLSARLPMVLKTLVLALAVAIGFWNWLGGVWHQQLADGQAWTTAGRLYGRIRRLTLGTGLAALLPAGLLALWPGLPNVPHRDTSLAGMAFGAGAYLVLLGALVWSGRQWRGPWFAALSVMTVLSLIAFAKAHT